MYRIFCESYQNYLNSFDKDNSRLKIAEPLELLTNIGKYQKEKREESELYKKISDLIYFMQENIERFPKLKAFLWTLSSREIKAKEYKVAKLEELEEQTKLINSFLKLAYWY